MASSAHFFPSYLFSPPGNHLSLFLFFFFFRAPAIGGLHAPNLEIAHHRTIMLVPVCCQDVPRWQHMSHSKPRPFRAFLRRSQPHHRLTWAFWNPYSKPFPLIPILTDESCQKIGTFFCTIKICKWI